MFRNQRLGVIFGKVGSTIYFISGLGIDHRIFQKLKFSRPFKIRHLPWIDPVKGESLQDYALRLSRGIDTTESYVIVGLSFGGMVATEIAKQLHPKKVLLISSASTIEEIPTVYKLLHKLRIPQIVPPALLKIPSPLIYWMFDIRTKEEKHMLRGLMADMQPAFMKWAIQSILNWQNKQRPPGILHIHGTSDKVLPAKYVKADKLVHGGGHLMVYTHAAELARLIENAAGD